jgi:signal transduction histidine kinase
MAVVVAVLGVLAVFTVRGFLLQRVDTNLDQQSTAWLTDIAVRQQQNLDNIDTSTSQLVDAVFYTIWNKDGKIAQMDRQMPVNVDDVSLALQGQSAIDTIRQPDGSKVRVMYKPIRYTVTNAIIGVLQASTPLAYIDQVISELTMLLSIAALALLLLGAVGSYMLTGRAFRAVDKVTTKVNQIESSQDLTQRLPETGDGDEIDTLVTTFNRLIARLQAAFDTQRRFVADSSHELRTPLTVIKSNLHLLRQTSDPAERAELLGVTEGEVAHLNQMVDDLLYMAQMQAGHDLKPVLRPVELDSLLLDVFARVRPLTMLKHQKFSLTHEDIATSMGDRDQLQHLLLNLLDNAVKYTGDGGIITLGLWSEDGWARIEVADNGTGISEEDLPLIFDRFFRTSDARLNQRNGSGLGLAIAKSIVEAHGGRIEVFSKLDEGTTFRVWLRLMDAPESPGLDYEDDLPAELPAEEVAEPAPVYATIPVRLVRPADILESP